MDYPAPKIGVTAEGELDVSEAYDVGIGAWDVQGARYAYADFGDSDEAAGLEAIVRDGIDNGLAFISDADARPPGAAQPVGSLWDNGSDAAEELANELEVRRIALERFGEHNVKVGTPLALLEEVLAPVYFHHRYQLEAAIKMVGGLSYGYPVRGDGQPGATAIPRDDQVRALEVVLTALVPAALDLPESVIGLLPPRPFGYRSNRELFKHRTAPGFDALGAAATASDLVVGGLLQHERAARLVDQHRRDADALGFEDVLNKMVSLSFEGSSGDETERRAAIRRETQSVIVDGLIGLAQNRSASPGVRAVAEGSLRKLDQSLSDGSDATTDMLAATISRFLNRSAADDMAAGTPPEIPPGSPIGGSLSFASQEFCSMASGSFLPGPSR